MTQPIERFQAGAVSCAIWENEITVNNRPLRILKAQVSRPYKDAQGAWRSSSSFSRNEIPMAIHCLHQAFAAIIDKDNERSDDNGVPEELIM